MSVALSIAFTGLCALATNGNGGPATVLLVDAKGVGEVNGVLLPDHAPTLVVPLRDLANAESSRPTRVLAAAPGQADGGQLGIWDLTGSEVRIRGQGMEGAGVQLFRPSAQETSWPDVPSNTQDPAAWRDLRFVADMQAITGQGRIDPALVAEGDASGRLPRAVAARIHLDSGVLEAAMPSLATYREALFEFRPDGGEPVLRQPLTDTIRWTLESDASAVVIDIVPVGGGPVRRLLLGPSATPHQLSVSNLPTANASHDGTHATMSDEERGALHFAAFYKLLLEPPAFVPGLATARAFEARKGAGGAGPAFCPPARFP